MGAAFPPSLLLGGAAWSPASLGGVAIPLSFGVELPSFRSFGYGLRSPSLLVGGAAWFLFFFCVVLLFLLFFCVVLLSFPFLSVVVLFSSLRLGGAALSTPPRGGVAFPISFCVLLPSFPSSGWDYLSPVFCWVVLLGPLGWCFVFFLLRGAAFLPLHLGGAAFLPSVGWCCWVFLLWVVLLFSLLLFVGVAKKKRRKVKEKLKTVAKWKNEKWKIEENEENEEM